MVGKDETIAERIVVCLGRGRIAGIDHVRGQKVLSAEFWCLDWTFVKERNDYMN